MWQGDLYSYYENAKREIQRVLEKVRLYDDRIDHSYQNVINQKLSPESGPIFKESLKKAANNFNSTAELFLGIFIELLEKELEYSVSAPGSDLDFTMKNEELPNFTSTPMCIQRGNVKPKNLMSFVVKTDAMEATTQLDHKVKARFNSSNDSDFTNENFFIDCIHVVLKNEWSCKERLAKQKICSEFEIICLDPGNKLKSKEKENTKKLSKSKRIYKKKEAKKNLLVKKQPAKKPKTKSGVKKKVYIKLPFTTPGSKRSSLTTEGSPKTKQELMAQYGAKVFQSYVNLGPDRIDLNDYL